ncbi:hypothetical protein [Microvirga solisilvae]|uniref:hypothetical protein n=1 Tax=Microvirga solisilvae TaxID=2919498 RepID=UPI001FAF05AB|nr:hypothetical protein [Microvirga solisilvae]
MHPLWIPLLLLSLALIGVGAWGGLKLSRVYSWLSICVGIFAAICSIPLGLIVAFGLWMCATRIVKEGELPDMGLSWVVKRSSCGVGSSDIYYVELGRVGWWRYTIFDSTDWPVPMRLESAGPEAVRVILGNEESPPDYVIPVSWLGQAVKPLAFHRGKPEE